MSLKKFGKGPRNFLSEELRHARAAKNAAAKKPRSRRNRKNQFSEIRGEPAYFPGPDWGGGRHVTH